MIILDELGERWSVERGDPAYPIVQYLKKLNMSVDYIILPFDCLILGTEARIGNASVKVRSNLTVEQVFRLWDVVSALGAWYTEVEEGNAKESN